MPEDGIKSARSRFARLRVRAALRGLSARLLPRTLLWQTFLLIALLLTLAKDPARLSRSNEVVPLHELLPDIIDDHRHLMEGKDLSVVIDDLAPCSVAAPLHIVQAAIGNLLRNAIENSDSGEIHVGLDGDATVTVQDPGHGMTPEDISRLYAQMARGGGREGGGIGLDLLARLCEHLGWTLSIQSAPGRGTISRLRLSR